MLNALALDFTNPPQYCPFHLGRLDSKLP
jgi:hypothetical protein